MYLYLLAFVAALIFYSIKIVRPVEKGVVEFLGKYSRTAVAGLNIIIPLLFKMYKINITEQRVDIEPQSIITKDKLNAEVDGVVYYKVVDPQKAIYNVNDFHTAVPSLAKIFIRQFLRWQRPRSGRLLAR
jgi:regulator of protease activity HflC (stomatin/prohibitin superfamily)